MVDAPFKVGVSSPAIAELGKPITLTITVTNKLWSIERLCVSAALCNRFLITGCTLRTLEVVSMRISMHAFNFTLCFNEIIMHFLDCSEGVDCNSICSRAPVGWTLPSTCNTRNLGKN